MSVAAQNVALQAVALVGQTVFPFGWRCDDPLTVIVYVNDVQDGGFAVAVNADQVGAPGGTITRAVACVGGEVVTVERASPQTQTVDLIKYGAFGASTVTTMADKATMRLQELAAILGRCFRAARSQVGKIGSLELPVPSIGSVLAWVDAGGGLFKLGTVTIAAISAAGTEVWGEPVARTGAGTYQLAHVPNVMARLRLTLNGGRIYAGVHYTVTALGAITQLAGFISDPAEDLRADYTY